MAQSGQESVRDVKAELEALEAGTTAADPLDLFDELPPVETEEMAGLWRGCPCRCGHPLEAVLARSGWYGKRFTGVEEVHPLLFGTSPEQRLVAVDPRWIPMALVRRHANVFGHPAVARPLARLAPLLRTRRPKARLRMMAFRGVVSATMIYDQLPILDSFRRVDSDTVLGVMDLRGDPGHFSFVLRRIER